MDRPIPFALPDIGPAEIDAVVDTLRSGWLTSGPQVARFETDFAESVGGGVEAVATNSATAGLHLALEALGVGVGDEVILPTWTFTATAEVVRYLGAQPVLVDVDRSTLNLSLERVVEALTPRTRAIIPVHMAGLPVDLRALRNRLGDRDIAVVEDAAHAFPASYGGSSVGSCEFSDACVFSFYANKPITTGEGGMVTTVDEALSDRMRVMRLHGIDRDVFNRYTAAGLSSDYDVVAPGFKYNMPDMAAALGRVQLARSNDLHARRKAIALRYLEAFAELPLDLPDGGYTRAEHAWHLFLIRLRRDAAIDRDGLREGLSALRISSSVHFTPLHQLTYWRETLATSDSDFPVASAESPSVLSLPLFSGMTDDQVERVIAAVKRLVT